MCNLLQGDRFILGNLTNPASDTLAACAKNLVVNKMNVHLKSSRMIAPIMRKAFEKFISQRHPLIIRKLKSLPNGVALMRDQELELPVQMDIKQIETAMNICERENVLKTREVYNIIQDTKSFLEFGIGTYKHQVIILKVFAFCKETLD